MKTKNKKRAPKIKYLSIPVRTAASKAIRKLKWSLKEKRLPGQCIKQGCNKKGCEGIFCKKHKKILRKVQLKLNNIPWRKKKVQPGYKPKQMHVVYAGKATKQTLADEKRARKRVKMGKSLTITTNKMLQKAIDAAKVEHKQSSKKEKKVKKVTKPVKAQKPKKGKKVAKASKVKRGKIAQAMDEETIDLT